MDTPFSADNQSAVIARLARRNNNRAEVWLVVKHAGHYYELPDHPKYFLEQSLRTAGIISIPITMQDIISVTDLPHHHGDPFDRLLVVQANERKMKLMSGDRTFKKYDVDLIHF